MNQSWNLSLLNFFNCFHLLLHHFLHLLFRGFNIFCFLRFIWRCLFLCRFLRFCFFSWSFLKNFNLRFFFFFFRLLCLWFSFFLFFFIFFLLLFFFRWLLFFFFLLGFIFVFYFFLRGRILDFNLDFYLHLFFDIVLEDDRFIG